MTRRDLYVLSARTTGEGLRALSRDLEDWKRHTRSAPAFDLCYNLETGEVRVELPANFPTGLADELAQILHASAAEKPTCGWAAYIVEPLGERAVAP